MSALVPAAPGNLHLHAMEHLAQVLVVGIFGKGSQISTNQKRESTVFLRKKAFNDLSYSSITKTLCLNHKTLTPLLQKPKTLTFQLSGALPETLSLSLPWSEVFLTSSLPSLRYHTATLLGIAARSSTDITLVDSWAESILSLLNDKV